MDIENLIFNKREFLRKKKIFVEEGRDKFHVLSDFDRTLTKAFVDGKETPSIISELRNRHYISEEYSAKAKELASIYHPIEIDSKIPIKKKKEKMLEWWTKHFDLLIKSGLNKKHIEQIVDSGRIQFREGALEFFDLLKEAGVPLVIISSSGLGGDSISLSLEKYGKLYDNISIVSNSFEWDSDGNAVGIKQPIIHVYNKNEASVKSLPVYKELLKRKDVLLLGDSLGDLEMVSGFKYKNLIKIGFLNENLENNRKVYGLTFDAVITGDGGFGFVNSLVRDIIKK